MATNPNGTFTATLPSGQTAILPAVVSVDATGAPVGGGGSGGGLPPGDFAPARLTLDGSFNGASNLALDWSGGSAGRAWVVIPEGFRFDLYAIRMFGDTSGGSPTYAQFFNISALGNGIEISSASGDGASTRVPLYRAEELKSNGGWVAKCGVATAVLSTNLVGLQRALSSPLSIAGGDCLQAVFSDDLSAIDSLYIELEGRLVVL